MVVAYITFPNRRVARRIGRTLVANKLAACVNIFPLESIYTWQGSRVEEKEVAMFAKTTARKFAALAKEVARLHPYTIPCIAKISVAPNEEYRSWLLSVLSS
ncbi:divalent-cation tolerance protein CutA [Candidatus Parcubacteria bacterium]|nr:MAG: divalent-cation tolerance protein CutA [Candidatus Parcubacteria bacterium]